MKDVWDNRVTMKENMAAMGVALNANDVMPFAGTKKSMINKLKKQKNVPIKEKVKPEVTKPEVVDNLVKEANVEAKPTFRFTTTQVQLITYMMDNLVKEANVEAKATFRFTTTQVQLITYMMDKHEMDFKAMSRDPKNHYQETQAKLKGMVTKFISIPEHYAPYCKSRGLITPSEKPVAETETEDKDEASDGEIESDEEMNDDGSEEEDIEDSEEGSDED